MTKRIAGALALVLLGAGAAFAQTIDLKTDGYVAAPLEPAIDWWTVLYVIVAVLGTAVIAFKSSGRTHLD